MAETAEQDTTTTTVEDRAAPPAGGGLQVEDRVTVTDTRPRRLAEEFRAAGFPGETATIPFEAFEDRAVTWTGSVDNINKAQATAGAMGADQRYAWPAFARVNVDAGATSVDVFTQTARTLPSAANVVRAIDAVTAKPEVASTLTIVTTALKQVAAIYTNVPNIQLEQPGVQHGDRDGPAAVDQRGSGQADPRLHRDVGVPGTGHRSAAGEHSEGDDDDHGQRLFAGHTALDARVREAMRDKS